MQEKGRNQKGEGKGKKGNRQQQPEDEDRFEEQRRERRRRQSLLQATMDEAPRPTYDVEVCMICTFPFEENEWCTRLVCKHIFHEACLQNMAQSSNNVYCPACI